MSPPLRLQLARVGKSYGSRPVFDDVSFSVEGGEILAVIGPNGSGKTTLLRIIAGLMRPDHGSVRRFGVGSRGVGDVAYFAGGSSLAPNLSVGQLLAMFHVAGPPGLSGRRRIGSLSKGIRQQIGLAAVLGRKASSLIVLDEPWDGLDPGASANLRDALASWRQGDRSVIVASHRLHELAGLATRYAVLNGGILSLLASWRGKRDRTTITSDLEARLRSSDA